MVEFKDTLEEAGVKQKTAKRLVKSEPNIAQPFLQNNFKNLLESLVRQNSVIFSI